MKNQLRIHNQYGAGLIGVMVAAALVVTAAMAISYFYVNQVRLAARIDNSMQCQQTLKSVVEYISKDNNSLFITSVGPRDANTAELVAEPFGHNFSTIDGVPQFPTTVNASSGTGSSIQSAAPQPSLNSQNAPLSPSWQFNNFLNIRNAHNRILSLSLSNGNVCCDNLDDMFSNDVDTPSCGIQFNPADLGLNNSEAVAIVAANFTDSSGQLACPLNANSLPSARNNSTAKVRVQVFTNMGTDEERFCTADATAYFSEDSVPPMVMMSGLTDGVNPGNPFCAAAAAGGTQYNCSPAATSVAFSVRTVANTNGNDCAACLAGLSNNSCPNPQNPITQCQNVCRDSDPGSIFLCRIGEKHWFDMNKNHWEPCEQTAVYGCTGGQYVVDNGLEGSPSNTCVGKVRLGTVNIQYLGNAGATATPMTRTEAVVRLSNLTAGRAYEIDVRAVDTRGLRSGPSFAGLATGGFTDGPHFIIPNDPPSLVGLNENSELIDRAGYAPGSTSVSDMRVYQNLAGDYQCQAGVVSFSSSVVYPSMVAWVYPFMDGESCSFSISGGTPNSTVGGGCSCSGGICSGTANVGSGGVWSARMDVSNICGTAGSGASSTPWCYEDVSSMTTNISSANTNTDTPSLSIQTTAPKKCPVSAGVGNITNPASPTFPRLGAGPYGPPSPLTNYSFSNIGWNPQTHSGCLREWFISPQICSVVTDVCGRQTKVRTTYESYLTEGAATTNSCQEVAGINVEGNRCIAGTYCDNTFNCKSTSGYARAGQACARKAGSGSYPYDDENQPCAHNSDCGFNLGVGSAYHIAGQCAGDSYKCVSGTVEEPGGSREGDACQIGNPCENVQRICFNSSDNTAVSPEESCGVFGCGSGKYCGNKANSGTCRHGSASCTSDADCAPLNGTTFIQNEGVCQSPVNTSCQECPNNGDLVMCPRVDGGCNESDPVLPSGNRSCASAPVVCAPGACVRGPELSRGECLKADNTPALLGEAGTRRVDYECRNNCSTCVGCPTPNFEPCVGTNIDIMYGCYVDTDAYDMPSTDVHTEGQCTRSNAINCTVGNRQTSRHGGGDPTSDPGDNYYFDGSVHAQFSVNWSGASWCSGRNCFGGDIPNGVYNPRVTVVHTPTGRTWNFSVPVTKNVQTPHPTTGDCNAVP